MEKVKLKAAWKEASIAINEFNRLYFVELRSKDRDHKLIGIIKADIGGVNNLIIPTNPNIAVSSIAKHLEGQPNAGNLYIQDYFAQKNLDAFGMEPDSSGRGRAVEFLHILGMQEKEMGDISIGTEALPYAKSDSIIFRYADSSKITDKDRSSLPSAIMRFHDTLEKAQIPLSVTPLSSSIVDRSLKTRVGVGLSAFFPESPKKR